MKALKVLIIVLATLCGIAFLLPKDFSVTRTIEINACVADVFKQANTLTNWSNWSRVLCIRTYNHSSQTITDVLVVIAPSSQNMCFRCAF